MEEFISRIACQVDAKNPLQQSAINTHPVDHLSPWYRPGTKAVPQESLGSIQLKFSVLKGVQIYTYRRKGQEAVMVSIFNLIFLSLGRINYVSNVMFGFSRDNVCLSLMLREAHFLWSAHRIPTSYDSVVSHSLVGRLFLCLSLLLFTFRITLPGGVS